MKTDLMRRLDYRVGVPVCFFLSVVNFFLKFFRRRPSALTRKILFVKLSEMGAIIQAYSLFRRVKELYPDAAVYFLTFEKNRELFAYLEDIFPASNVLSIREDTLAHFAGDTIRNLFRLRSLSLDAVFDLEMFSRFTAGISFLSGAPRRVGFYRYTMEGLYRGNLETHRVSYNPLLHISKLYLSMSQALVDEEKTDPALSQKIEKDDILLPVFVSQPERLRQVKAALQAAGLSKDERLFLINPGEGTLPLREWPLENFIGLAKKILNVPGNRIVLVGTAEAVPKARTLCRSLDDRCVDFSGRTTLTELLELFGISEALIANDSGLAHLAALTPVKKFVIFGPETPQVFGPLEPQSRYFYAGLPCSPCLSAFNHRRSVCRRALCLTSVSVEAVYGKIAQVCSLGVAR